MSGHLGVLGLWYRWGRGIRLASSDAISVDFAGMSAVSPTDLERREEIEPGPSLCCQSGLTQSIDNAQGRFLCPCSHFWEVSRPGVLCPLRMPPTAVFQKKKKKSFSGQQFFPSWATSWNTKKSSGCPLQSFHSLWYLENLLSLSSLWSFHYLSDLS